ncbi:MAG: hypothetical protein ACPGXK_15105 [Phycisphaerae bacterium]
MHCLSCQYDLHGLDDAACPECGRPFVPGDATTYATSATPSWAYRAFPPTLLANLLAIGLAIWYVEGVSRQVALGLVPLLIVPVGLAILVMDWTVRRYACSRMRRNLGSHQRPSSGHWWGLPVGIVLALSTVAYPWPMEVRFAASQSDMQSVAENLKAGQTIKGPTRVGLYWMTEVSQECHDRIVFITGFSWAGPVGFVFDPADATEGGNTRRLDDRWFATEF